MKNLLLLLFIIPFFAHATTYYVAPTGNDNNAGTINSPFKNWQKLGSVMHAGDIAYIRGGTYITPYTALNVYIHCLWNGLNGTAANPIVIQNYPGESPVFDFSSLGNSNRDYAQALYIENCSYLTVKGLRITGMKQILDGSGICIGNSIMSSNFVTLERMEIDHIGGTGFRTGNSNDITYINCDTHHNDDRYSPNDPWGGTDGFSGSGGEGSTRTTYIGCRAWWNSDDGWDFYGTDGKRTMINCWSFWNGYQPGTFLPAGNGNGFKLGPTATDQSANVLKYLNNCLAFENRSSGFDQNNGQCKYQMYNNTSYKNGQYGYEWAYYTNITQDFKNNIGYANVGTQMHHSGNATGSYNTWNGGVTVNNADFLSISSLGMDGPRQPDGSLPILNFMKLAQGSDLIDAGTNVGLPYNGSAPDIGAYEFDAASITPPVVGTISQPTCTLATGSVVLNGLPSSGTWTLTRTPGGNTTTGTGTTTTISGLPSGTYTFTVSNGSSTSAPSANIVINPQPATPNAPSVGTITQPTCAVATGLVVLNGLPASGTWTLTRTPGGNTTTGTGATTTIAGLAAGSYTYIVSNASGCSSAASANIVINAQPATPNAPNVGTTTQPTCAVANGSVVLNNLPAAGIWTLTRTPGGNTTTGTGTSTTINGLAAGSYTYTVTNILGCTSVASANIVINAQPATPNAPTVGTVTQPTCAVATGSVVLSGLPASGTWTLTRTPGGITTTGTGTSTTITGLDAGTYSYTVTNASGCVSVISANIVINTQPATPNAPTLGAVTQPTCAMPTGSVDINNLPATGTWTLTRTPGGNTTSGTGTSTTINGLAAGSYTYTVTNASGCTSPASANVIIIAPPGTPATPTIGTITQPTCAVATGSVDLNNLPAGTWTLTRTPGGNTTTGSGTSTTITGLDAGTYTYTVTNASGCVSVASANIVINPQPATPNAPSVGTITQPTCAVATGLVVLSGLPASGTWTLTRTPGGNTTTGTGTTTTIAGLAAGSYTYIVSNASGCSSAASANIVINAQPATPNAPNVGTTTQPTCAVATGSVVLNNLPAAGIWTLTRTPGGNTTTGTGTSTTINGLAAGSYTYTVTNILGCTSVASANIVINAQPATPNAPTVGTVTQPTCAVATGSVVLSGLPASGTWTLTRTPGGITTTGTGTSTTITGLDAGTYSYTVTNASGCVSVISANIVINTQPATPNAPTLGAVTQPTCAMPTGSVDINNLPATGTWTLTRTPGGNTTSGTGTSTTINGLAAGSYTYTVTNASGCTSPASANVIIIAPPGTPATPTIGTITQPTCAVATGSVDLNNLPAGTWTLTRTPGGNTTTGSGTSTTITGLDAGTYTYTVTNASGCVSVASANIVINPQPATPNAPSVGTITQPTCAVATGLVVLSGLPASGTWTLTRTPGGNTTTGTGTTTTIAGLAAGSYTYIVSNASGCSSAASANIVINAQPATPNAPNVGTTTQPTCAVANGSVVLNNLPAAGIWTLTRTPGGNTTTGTGTSTTINGLAAGTYTYTVTNILGCTSVASANIVINAQPATPNAPTVGTVTQPTGTVLTGAVILNNLPSPGTWTLTRTPGGNTTTGTGTSTTITGLAPGTYTYIVTNASGCVSVASANVVIVAANNPPVANAGPDQNISLPVNFTSLTGSGSDIDGTVVGYEWKQLSGPSNNVLFSLNTAFTYINNLIEGNYVFELTVTDNLGAKGRDTVIVTVTGIQNPTPVIHDNDIKIYPNPVMDITTLEITKTNENSKVLEMITDAQGKVILLKELSSQQNTIHEKIDMSSNAKGIYFVTVIFRNNEKKTLKVIKVK